MDLQASIRFETFEEYFTITSYVGLDSTSVLGSESQRWATTSKHGANLIIDEINTRLHDLRRRGGQNASRLLTTHQRAAVRHIYHDVWDSFRADFLDNGLSRSDTFLPGHTAEGAATTLHLSEAVFADFRGLILGVDLQTQKPDSPDTHAPLLRTATVEAPVGASLPTATRIQGVTRALASNDYEDIAEAIIPILLANDGLTRQTPWHAPFEPIDYTFSVFGKGRFIYGSGFGAQLDPDDAGSLKSGSPLTYIAVALHDDWRQIGRMLIRLHTLGTLRLAALFELNKLMNRDQILLTLEEELQQFDQIRTTAKLRDRRKAALGEYCSAVARIIQLESFSIGFQETHNQITQLFRGYSVAADNLFDLVRYHGQRSDIIELLVRMEGELESCKERLKLANFPSKESTETIATTRQALRASLLFMRSNNLEDFRSVVLELVKRALSGMNEGVREGINYRAARSRYSRELFESLAKAMRIGRIRGYQPYDLFVSHRLERAYRLIQAIDARFRQVTLLEAQLRQRLDSQKSVRHQEVLSRLQRTAENAFWFVLAPYYSAHVVEFIVGGFRPDLAAPYGHFAHAAGTAVALMAIGYAIKRAFTQAWRAYQVHRQQSIDTPG